MSLPTWSLSDIFTQVSAFLDQDAVKAMVIAIIALGLAERIVGFLRHTVES